ncbi:hypothetical protein Bbelb_140860 [Branchiostoma belcheri]|nr:hypothetical protein Bbelb_140860 [Branchiostoma belcheri]
MFAQGFDKDIIIILHLHTNEEFCQRGFCASAACVWKVFSTKDRFACKVFSTKDRFAYVWKVFSTKDRFAYVWKVFSTKDRFAYVWKVFSTKDRFACKVFSTKDRFAYVWKVFSTKDRFAYVWKVFSTKDSNLPWKQRLDLEEVNVEMLWLEVTLPQTKPMLICCTYRPPGSSIQTFNNIIASIDRATDSNNEVFILGDFNIDWSNHLCPLRERLAQAAVRCNLLQSVKSPTRIGTNNRGQRTETHIDLVFTNCAERCTPVSSTPLGFSDHNIVYTTRKTKVPKAQPRVVERRAYGKFNPQDFQRDIELAPWHLIYNESDVNMALHVLTTILNDVADSHAPVKKRTVRSNTAPWLDDELRELMHLREEARRESISSRLESDVLVYKKLRNAVVKLNRKKKAAFYKTKLEETKHDPKALWKTLNGMLGKNRNQPPCVVEQDGAYLTRAEDVAEYFNHFFTQKVDSLRNGLNSEMGDNLLTLIKREIMENNHCKFEFSPVNVEEVHSLLSSLPDGKAMGLDNLDNTLLKLAANHIALPLCYIINLSFTTSVYPSEWKKAKVIPLPKSTSARLSGPNARPISLLSSISKIAERVVYNQISQYFLQNSLMTTHQHGFRKHYSTCTALLEMVDDWYRNIDCGNLIGVIFLDFSAAFDLVDHAYLLRKLQCYGFDVNPETGLQQEEEPDFCRQGCVKEDEEE